MSSGEMEVVDFLVEAWRGEERSHLNRRPFVDVSCLMYPAKVFLQSAAEAALFTTANSFESCVSAARATFLHRLGVQWISAATQGGSAT